MVCAGWRGGRTRLQKITLNTYQTNIILEKCKLPGGAGVGTHRGPCAAFIMESRADPSFPLHASYLKRQAQNLREGPGAFCS